VSDQRDHRHAVVRSSHMYIKPTVMGLIAYYRMMHFCTAFAAGHWLVYHGFGWYASDFQLFVDLVKLGPSLCQNRCKKRVYCFVATGHELRDVHVFSLY